MFRPGNFEKQVQSHVKKYIYIYTGMNLRIWMKKIQNKNLLGAHLITNLFFRV